MAVPEWVGKGESGMEKKLKDEPSAASGVMADTFTVHLTRREIMHLPIETRRRILAEQVDTFLTHCEGCQEEIPDSELDQANYTADDVFLCGECCEGMLKP